MARIVLLHGFATGLDVSVFRPARGTDAGFLGFADLIGKGIATPFRWDERESLSFWKSLSPLTYLTVYRREAESIRSERTLASLETFLNAERPCVIVCHSMGCALLLSYLSDRRLPASVRHVVFIQADVPRGAALPETANVTWHNLFCPWDPTLLLSALYHRTIRAGQLGLTDQRAANRFVALWRRANLHTASISDPGVAAWAARLD